MLPDRVSNPGPLTYESGALPIALRGPAFSKGLKNEFETAVVIEVTEGLLDESVLESHSETFGII